MNWLEMIRVRTSKEAAEAIWRELPERMPVREFPVGLDRVSVMLHALCPGDVAVVLEWSRETAPAKSAEGTFLAQYLEMHGLVDHSVWRVAQSLAEHHPQSPDARRGKAMTHSGVDQ